MAAKTSRGLGRSLSISSALITGAVVCVSISGCNFFAETKQIVGSQSSTSLMGDLGPGTVGIKQAKQVSVSMSRVTGVDPSESFMGGQSMRSQSNIIQGWLSGDGTVESLNGTMQLTITGLAGSYCRRFLEKEAANATASTRLAHAAVNFGAGTAGLSAQVLDDVTTKYHELFLRRAPTADHLQAIKDEMPTTIAAVNALNLSNSERVQRALLVPCTAILGGLEFLTF